MAHNGIGATFADAQLIDGVRTPFADYNGMEISDAMREQTSRFYVLSL